MQFPNKYLRNLKPYKLASHKIWQVHSDKRPEILKLDWNEATIPPTPLVKDNLYKLLSEPPFFNLYPITYNEELMEKLSNYVKLPKENIQYFSSSDALHEYLCKVYISVGDPVLILGPSYDNFRLTCQANGANVFYSNYTENFKFDADAFESDIMRIDPNMVYICNPNNPTGNLHSIEYIKYLLDRFSDTLFLIDEAYCEFSGVTAKDLVIDYDNILISRTMSKAFALANFRVGYLIASKSNIDFINRIRNPKNLSTIAQVAAISALSDIPYMKNYVKEVNIAKEEFKNKLESLNANLKIVPSHGNFLLIEFHSYGEKIELLNYLASKNIYVRDTTQSKLVEKCFRITIGLPSQMDYVYKNIREFYAKQ